MNSFKSNQIVLIDTPKQQINSTEQVTPF